MQSQLISSFKQGLNTDLTPWLVPPDGFSFIDNLHIHHERIESRNGYILFGTLKEPGPAIAISGITNAADGVVTAVANHGLSTGDVVFIKDVLGMTEVNDISYTITVTGLATFELNISTLAFGVYAGAGDVYKEIADTDRVMGIDRFVKPDGTFTGLAWNTTRANIYNTTLEDYKFLDPDPIMDGSDTDYIWCANWQASQGTSQLNRLYFTNGKAFDGTLNGIRFYDETGEFTTQFVPDLGGGDLLYGGKLVFAIKERLVVLHTFELEGSLKTYPQRARWCQAQNPTPNPVASSGWNDLLPGKGGFVDAPTGDQIISARQIQNQIIVFFTNSVWTLRPTSNPAIPFVWDKINDFRSCDGKMASTTYDRYAIAIGSRGITATDGVETKRTDDRITDFVSEEISVAEFKKVFCARNFTSTKWWTLFTDSEETSTDNNKALIYDDESSSFSTYSINMNCLGYGNASQDYALSDFTAANDLDWTLDSGPGDETLQSFYFEDNKELFLGGSINGKVFLLDSGESDEGTTINCQFITAYWNPFRDQGIEVRMPCIDFYIDTDQETTAKIQFYKNDDEAPFKEEIMDFLPDLGYLCSISDASNANPCVITAASHGLTTGDTIYIYLVQGMLQLNDIPFVVTVIDQGSFSLNGIDSTAYGTYTGGGKVYQNPFYRTQTWKRVYGGGIGYQHKIGFISDQEDKTIRIHAYKPYFKPTGKRFIQ